ncbi:MAG: hypothetical protein V7637_89, partial [Mycobacteriales bacterium]
MTGGRPRGAGSVRTRKRPGRTTWSRRNRRGLLPALARAAGRRRPVRGRASPRWADRPVRARVRRWRAARGRRGRGGGPLRRRAVRGRTLRGRAVRGRGGGLSRWRRLGRRAGTCRPGCRRRPGLGGRGAGRDEAGRGQAGHGGAGLRGRDLVCGLVGGRRDRVGRGEVRGGRRCAAGRDRCAAGGRLGRRRRGGRQVRRRRQAGHRHRGLVRLVVRMREAAFSSGRGRRRPGFGPVAGLPLRRRAAGSCAAGGGAAGRRAGLTPDRRLVTGGADIRRRAWSLGRWALAGRRLQLVAGGLFGACVSRGRWTVVSGPVSAVAGRALRSLGGRDVGGAAGRGLGGGRSWPVLRGLLRPVGRVGVVRRAVGGGRLRLAAGWAVGGPGAGRRWPVDRVGVVRRAVGGGRLRLAAGWSVGDRTVRWSVGRRAIAGGPRWPVGARAADGWRGFGGAGWPFVAGGGLVRGPAGAVGDVGAGLPGLAREPVGAVAAAAQAARRGAPDRRHGRVGFVHCGLSLGHGCGRRLGPPAAGEPGPPLRGRGPFRRRGPCRRRGPVRRSRTLAPFRGRRRPCRPIQRRSFRSRRLRRPCHLLRSRRPLWLLRRSGSLFAPLRRPGRVPGPFGLCRRSLWPVGRPLRLFHRSGPLFRRPDRPVWPGRAAGRFGLSFDRSGSLFGRPSRPVRPSRAAGPFVRSVGLFRFVVPPVWPAGPARSCGRVGRSVRFVVPPVWPAGPARSCGRV